MNRLHTLAIVGAVIAGGSNMVAQDNLRERARANGGVAELHIVTEFGVTTLDELVANAPVIVHGRISASRPHLSVTETMVLTDYTVTPHRFLKLDRSLVTATSPARTPPLVVRCPGGTVVEGTTRFSAFVDAFPGEGLPLGAEVVLFLGYDPNDKVFYFFNGPFGIYRVRDGEMHAVHSQTASRRSDTPATSKALNREISRSTQNSSRGAGRTICTPRGRNRAEQVIRNTVPQSGYAGLCSEYCRSILKRVSHEATPESRFFCWCVHWMRRVGRARGLDPHCGRQSHLECNHG